MNYKIIRIMWVAVLMTVFILPTSPGFTQQGGNDNDPHKTGLKELTPEELRIIHETHPRVHKVKLNKLGLERVNAHRKKLKLNEISIDAADQDGQELETTLGAASSTTTTTTTSSSALAAIPDNVDNSVLKYFPPIRSQGSLNSCAAFSGVYYAMTYMYAKVHDLDAKNGTEDTRLSPKWGYNLVNGGGNNGTWYYWMYDVGIKHGIATWAEMPYDGNYLAWSTDPLLWRQAVNRRFLNYGYVGNMNTDSGINLAKQMLVDGYVLNIPTYINSWQYKTIGNDFSTTLDDPFVGKSIAYWVNGTAGYHAMTVVGYNDNIWVDINGNSVVDSGEKGAFRIANSWGTGWGEGGFVWIAYDALKNPSAVTGGPSTGRVTGFYPASAHWINPRPSYTPKMLAQFALNHLKRNQLSVTLGVSDTAHTTPTSFWYPSYALANTGGAYAFNGGTLAVDGGFVFDFTDILPTNSGTYHLYVGVQDSISGDVSLIKDYKIIDVANAGAETVSNQVPTSIDAGQIYPSVDYAYNNGNAVPTAVVQATPLSGYVPLTVNFDASASSDTDGTIASYLWDFGDGVTTTGSKVSHAYKTTGNFSPRLTVTDNLGASQSRSVVVAVSQDPNVINAPSNLSTTTSSRTVTIRWVDNSNNETAFYIERAIKSKSTPVYQKVNQVPANSVVYQETLQNSGTYLYRVQAVNATLGKVSGYSNSASVRIR